MKKRFFLKNFGLMMLTLIVPVIVLGSLSMYITTEYVRKQIDENSTNILSQSMQSIELMLGDADTLAVNFDHSSYSAYYLNMLLNGRLTEDKYVGSMVENILNSNISSMPYTKLYIDSIYIFLKNVSDSVLTSNMGLVSLSSLNDIEWHKWYSDQPETNEIVKLRDISAPSIAEKPLKIVSVFKRLREYSGCVVLNIKAEKIQELLDSLLIHSNQTIMILDEKNERLFSSGSGFDPAVLKSTSLRGDNSSLEYIKTPAGEYAVTFRKSSRYNWTYVSIIPVPVLYHIPETLFKYTILLSAICLVLGTILTFLYTNRNYMRLNNILRIFETAEKGEALPPLPSRIRDEYGFILGNIIKTFIEKNYLSLQLLEKQHRMQLMELVSLQSQMNPHFLYNTLNTIYWETYKLTGTPNKANNIIENLSDVLRYCLESPTERVTFGEEIKFTENYLNIQKERYHDKFNFINKCHKAVFDIKVLKLILQPVVENSIYHGIKPKKEKCNIRIRAFLRKNILFISVLDTGVGIEKKKLQEIRNELNKEVRVTVGHIAIYNTNRRLKLSYGEQYGLKVLSTYGRGTAVYLELPVELV